ncbi:unnamed protein product [Adineta steineri]|uniref:VASt domain-containing protein n=1 Tax=Adineta steineri TaxID=433720 RepID=A0A813SE13_9BILA|nr:unnamed protein product [Adineta steineri]CAF3545881.1 unnamed protein product [Adineta steineri]
MSHIHDDEENPMTVSFSNDNGIHRHRSHTFSNLKPANVLDHIKTKVKRKHNPTKSLLDTPVITVHYDRNENNNTKQTQEDGHNQLNPPSISLTKAQSQPTISTLVITDQHSKSFSDNENHDEENYISMDKTENNITISEPINQNDHTSLNVPKEDNQQLSDTENNKKNTKTKTKLNKASKTTSEPANQSDSKRRSQKSRYTVEYSSKKQQNKKNKKDDHDNMETFPYLTGFQIRDEDFNNIFELPADEQLIIAYSCLWRKDMYMHGRIFLSVNYLCFYTCFFKWEESVRIAWKDIISIKREKSVKVLSNAIKMETKNGEQHVFATFISRERILVPMCRLWQNALAEKPLEYQQLRTIVLTDSLSHDESSDDSEQSIRLKNNRKQSSDRYPQSQSQSPVLSKHRTKSSVPSEDTEQVTYVSACPCETHLARTIIDRSYSYDVDKLYEFIFEDSEVSRAYHESQKLIDFNLGEWHINNETGKRERQVTYKLLSQSILGTNTITCTEKQTIEVEIPHSVYVINTDVYNEGVKYTDSFYVASRYCMYQRDAKHSSLRISAEIKYIKSVNGFIKSFIEKNCNSSIDEGHNDLARKLESQQSVINNRKPDQKQAIVHKKRVHKQKPEEEEEEGIRPDNKQTEATIESVPSSNVQVPVKEKTITGKGIIFDIALFIGIFLLLLHIYLCYKLYSVDRILQISESTCVNQCKKTCLQNKFQQ